MVIGIWIEERAPNYCLPWGKSKYNLSLYLLWEESNIWPFSILILARNRHKHNIKPPIANNNKKKPPKWSWRGGKYCLWEEERITFTANSKERRLWYFHYLLNNLFLHIFFFFFFRLLNPSASLTFFVRRRSLHLQASKQQQSNKIYNVRGFFVCVCLAVSYGKVLTC